MEIEQIAWMVLGYAGIYASISNSSGTIMQDFINISFFACGATTITILILEALA